MNNNNSPPAVYCSSSVNEWFGTAASSWPGDGRHQINSTSTFCDGMGWVTT